MCAGISSLIFLFVVGLGEYAVALAFVVALLDVIPMIGATIGAVIVTAIAFADGLEDRPRLRDLLRDLPAARELRDLPAGDVEVGRRARRGHRDRRADRRRAASASSARCWRSRPPPSILMLTREVWVRRQDDALGALERRGRGGRPLPQLHARRRRPGSAGRRAAGPAAAAGRAAARRTARRRRPRAAPRTTPAASRGGGSPAMPVVYGSAAVTTPRTHQRHPPVDVVRRRTSTLGGRRSRIGSRPTRPSSAEHDGADHQAAGRQHHRRQAVVLVGRDRRSTSPRRPSRPAPRARRPG